MQGSSAPLFDAFGSVHMGVLPATSIDPLAEEVSPMASVTVSWIEWLPGVSSVEKLDEVFWFPSRFQE